MISPLSCPEGETLTNPCPRRENPTDPLPKNENLTKTQYRELACGERICLAMTHGNVHMERKFRLALTHESMHALEVRIHNLDQKLCLHPIGKLAALLPYCMLTRGLVNQQLCATNDRKS